MRQMKSELEWEQDIINITTTISKQFPELSKFIAEMPENSSEENEVNVKSLKAYYQSLEELMAEYAKTHKSKFYTKSSKNSNLPGYPVYPPSEDIYRQSKEEMDINPEDISKMKTPNERAGTKNEKGFEDDMSGDDLDVPGSELDDEQESVGSEDEENNYYSIGGDNHNDLDED
jgi:hypothetical protein